MALAPLPEVTVTPVTHLPQKYFLENLVVRADGSVLITALLSKELWLVPAPARELGEPVLLHRFDHLTTGIVEVEPDVFVVSLSELYTTHESHLVRIDLNGWTRAHRSTRRSSTRSTRGCARLTAAAIPVRSSPRKMRTYMRRASRWILEARDS
jgi:hypothetical protein